MQTVKFNCPLCGERGHARAELIGQSVTCPGCSQNFVAVKEKANWIPGALLSIAGLAMGAITFHFQSTWPPEAIGLGEVASIVLIGSGLANLLWMANAVVFALAGPIAIMAGFLILVISLFANSIIGAIAGGCSLMFGGMLLLRKK